MIVYIIMVEVLSGFEMSSSVVKPIIKQIKDSREPLDLFEKVSLHTEN